jgi:hypothetical protein
MTEENINKLIDGIMENAFIPNEWLGVSDIRVVRLDDVLMLINRLKDVNLF